MLQQRYDLRPRRRLSARARWGLIGAALLVATLFVVWIVQGRSAAPSSKDVGFDLISSAQVTADFEVTRDPDQAVRCGVEMRVVVAVDRRPPGTHPVDKLAAVGKLEAHAACRRHNQRSRRRRERAVRVPDVVCVKV